MKDDRFYSRPRDPAAVTIHLKSMAAFWMDRLMETNASGSLGTPEYHDETSPHRAIFPAGTFVLLSVLIGCLALGGAIAGVVVLVLTGSASTSLAVAVIAGLVILGICGWVLLLISQRVGRQLSRLLEQVGALEQRAAILAEQTAARSREAKDAPAAAVVDPLEMRALFTDIRDILLLPQELRIRRYQAAVEAEHQRRLAAAERYIASRDFHRARDELAALAERFGVDDRLREARNRLEHAAEEARAQDISQATARAQDLMSLSRWDEAERLAAELADKYPAATEPAALRERIQRERVLFEQRNRQRMLEEIQQWVRQRRWREAAAGTRRFLELFPRDIEAPALREQLATLDANAEIQTRQQLEQQYKELLAQHRYWDALGLARRIIGEFPFSPQAKALRNQVARVEELARQLEPQA